MTEAMDKLIAAVEAGSWDGSWRWLLDNILDSNHCRPFSDAYHGSLDSAVALKDALLPGWGWHCGVYGARVWEYPGDEWHPDRRQDIELPYQPARALLLATLRAVKGERDGSLNRPA